MDRGAAIDYRVVALRARLHGHVPHYADDFVPRSSDSVRAGRFAHRQSHGTAAPKDETHERFIDDRNGSAAVDLALSEEPSGDERDPSRLEVVQTNLCAARP